MLKIKQHIKRITSMLLVILMLTSSVPITSYATETGGIGGINGGNTSGSVNNSNDSRAWSNNEQGYRFYIINENFERISEVYDFYFAKPTNISNIISTTRFDTGVSPSSMPSPQPISALASLSGSSVSEIPKAYANGTGNGIKFRQWFLKNIGYHAGSGGIGGGLASTTGGGTLGGFTGSLQPNAQEQAMITSGEAYINTGQYISFEGFTDTEQAQIKSVMKYWVTADPSGDFSRLHTVMEYNRENFSTKVVTDQAVFLYTMGNICSTYKQTRGYSAAMVSYIAYWLYMDNFNLLAKSNNNQDILKQNIPLAAAITPEYSDEHSSIPGCPAITLLENTSAFQVPGYQTAAEALMDGCYLVVEPVTWLCMPVGTSYPSSRTYGSMGNLLTQWQGTDSYGFYGSSSGKASLMNYHFTSCMTVDSTYTAVNGRQILQAPAAQVRTASATKALFSQGYGVAMHVYSAKDFGVVGTSTYDEPLGPTPGSAPDDSPTLKPEEKTDETKHANIVKFYESYVDGELDSKQSFTRETTPKTITIEDEIEYRLTDWYTSVTFKSASGSTPTYEDYKNSMSQVQQGTSTETITLENETTLYVLLVKEDGNPEAVEGDWTLSESRLTKIAKTTNTDKGDDILSKLKFIVNFGELNDWHGHGGCGSCHGGHSDGRDCGSCHGGHGGNMYIEDKEVTVFLKNATKDATLISSLSGETWGDKWEPSTGQKENRNGLGYETGEVTNYKYTFLVHRSGKDNTMLYTGLVGPSGTTTANAVPNLVSMGFKSGTSQASARTNGGKIYNLVLDMQKNEAKGEYSTASKCEDDSHTDTDIANITGQQIPGTLGINTYAGRSDGGFMNTDCDDADVMYIGLSGFDHVSGKMINSGKSFSFTPYIKMQYDNIDTQNTITYALGQYVRRMSVNDYAEIAWNYQDTSNLHVTSNQWSAHAGALKLTGGKTNIVLPGGALHSLDTKNSEQKLRVNTYQTILINNGLAQAEYTEAVSEELKKEKAIQYHLEYVQSVMEGFSNVEIEQYVNEDMNSEYAWNSGIKVYNGSDIQNLKNGSSKSSKDNKYYFKSDTGSGTDDNDLDAFPVNDGATIEEGIKNSTATHYYTFYSDTEGNIRMAKDGASTGSIIIPKNGDISNISDYTAKMINNRTYVVTKLVDAIERNTGNDGKATWVSDGHWYNEAFNGVTVVVQSTDIKVGLFDPSVRSTILDPKLIPQQTSKRTMFEKAFLCQFRTSPKSTVYGKDNVIGMFKGEEIQTKELNKLFWSNKFYIPDVNVQDLS